ncbi:hypothetical protein [Okeania sp. KiyG1]|uniref:hypothetical protein n=1 Tax=Okeania sp. KiyG1 TaxID=2720165 RepID=UPI001923D5C1|nr:hypothetical protein [Okeania sp. KiyG1]
MILPPLAPQFWQGLFIVTREKLMGRWGDGGMGGWGDGEMGRFLYLFAICTIFCISYPYKYSLTTMN